MPPAQKEKNSSPSNQSEDEEYEVETILDKKGKRYQVRWVGWEDPTWEPVENLASATELIEEFELLRKTKNHRSGNSSTARTVKHAKASSTPEGSPEIEAQPEPEKTDEDDEEDDARQSSRHAARPKGKKRVEVRSKAKLVVNGSTKKANYPVRNGKRSVKRSISLVDGSEAAFQEENGGHQVVRIVAHKPIKTDSGKVKSLDDLEFLVVYGQAHADQYVGYEIIMNNDEAKHKLTHYLAQLGNVVPRH